MTLKFIHVSAAVRYWEDARINGIESELGDLIPFKVGSLWKPIINLETGTFVGWPQGMKASFSFKVCDAGEYWLSEDGLTPSHKWQGDYVPDDFLCHGDNGYGDYIILKVNESGKIEGYRKPEIDLDEWQK